MDRRPCGTIEAVVEGSRMLYKVTLLCNYVGLTLTAFFHSCAWWDLVFIFSKIEWLAQCSNHLCREVQAEPFEGDPCLS